MAASVRIVNEQSLKRLVRMPAALNAELERRLGAAALIGKRSVEARLPASRRLRGVGNRGARVGVRYDVKGSGVNAVALLRATGPLHLLDNPTKPHRIEPRRRRRGGKRAVLVNGQPVAYVEHPGTRGKRTFARGVEAAKPRMTAELRKAVPAAVGKALRG